MRLKALDQIHVSAVQADSLRPQQQFDVSDAAGEELMKAHPGKFEQVADEPAPAEKAAPAVRNKDEGAPSKNKSATSAKSKA